MSKSKTNVLKVDNFRIIVTDDIALAKSIIESKYSKNYGQIKYLDNPFESRHLFTSKSFLCSGNNKYCYVCKNIDSLIKNENDWDAVLSGKFLNGNVLVYICNKLDLRTKFAKKFKPVIFSINSDSINISDVFDKSLKLSKTNRDTLFKMCNNSVTKFISEFDKLDCYCDFEKIDDYDDAFNKLLSDGLFANHINYDTFILVNYIMTRQIDKVYKFISNSGKLDFDFGLLTILYTNFRNLYIFGCAAKLNKLSSTTLTPFMQSNMRKYISYYTAKDILNIMKFLRDLDYSIKKGSVISEFALDYMLCGVLKCVK